ncbi:MAG: hypothetical protein WA194_07685 [Patescibacteria group bacterium]
MKEEKLRATPVVTRIEKPAPPTDFKEDGEKSCAGTACVEKTEAFSGSGSALRQLSCDSMGEKGYLAEIPADIRDASISADVLPKCDRLTLVSIDQGTKNAKVTERNGKWYRFEETSKIPGGYAVFSKTSWCGGSKWTQKILSDAGMEITALVGSGSLPYPETLKVGIKEFKAQELSANDQPYYLGTLAKTVEFPRTLSVKDDVSAEFEKYVLDRSFIAESYLFTFEEYPGLRVKYLTKTTPSERIVNLGDAKRIARIVQPVTDSLLDAKLTERILKEYDPSKSARLLIPLGTSKEKALLPKAAYDKSLRIVPFRMDEFDTKGNFLLYSNTDYEFVTFGDACAVGLDDAFRKALK